MKRNRIQVLAVLALFAVAALEEDVAATPLNSSSLFGTSVGTGTGFIGMQIWGGTAPIDEGVAFSSTVVANFEGTRQAVASATVNNFSLGIFAEDAQTNSFVFVYRGDPIRHKS